MSSTLACTALDVEEDEHTMLLDRAPTATAPIGPWGTLVTHRMEDPAAAPA